MVLDCPKAIEEGTAEGAGAEGAVQVTVTVTVLLSTIWTPLHEFETRTE
jgi:hypothetical protein